jgi:chloramphenicol-sensitive protein RarD
VTREGGPSAAGLLYALGAYGSWGLTPIYWKWVASVPADELVVWRALWSFAVAFAFCAASGRGSEVRRLLASPRRWLPLAATGALLAVNWLTFVYAVQTDRIVATSLGYYLSPLVHVCFGVLLLAETLPRAQAIALGIATAGVAYLTYEYGELPWIALVLPTTFGVYGLVRKVASAQPLAGFALEMALLLPAALGYAIWLLASGRSALLAASWRTNLLVAASGIVTALPLIWFVSAARRLPLVTLGMFQYLSPSLALGIAVWLYAEPFTRVQAITFGGIWLALSLYSLDMVARARSARAPGSVAPDPASGR